MTTIPENFGEGGQHLVPKGTTTEPSLAETLRDIADDLAAGKAAEIVSVDAVDLATAITLVNEIKAALNAVDATALKTIKG